MSDWREQAACRMPAVDPDVFWPEYKVPGRGHEFERKAEAVCRRCSVTQACLVDALEREDRWSIRAGLTPEERRHIVADRRGRAA